MSKFIAKRTFLTLATMFVASLAVYLALELSPGDVATKVLGPYSTQEQRDLWNEANGFHDPLHIRYFRWLGNVLQGDFGDSIRFKVPISEILWPRLGNTALLGGMVFLIVIPLSLTLGMLAGMKEGSLLDRSISVFSVITTSVPEFASAVLLAAVFVFWLVWLPGTSTMSDGFSLREMVLPVLVLVLFDFGYIARMTRASMVEVMTRQYIRTAVLKGLPYRRVIVRHALRNALIAPFTVIMLQFSWLLSGVVVVEYFFAYKGFGTLLLEAALNKDWYLILACTMVSILVVVSAQTLQDIGYAFLNPRIRVN